MSNTGSHPYIWSSDDEYVLFNNTYEYITNKFPNFKILFIKEVEFDFPEIIVIELMPDVIMKFAYIQKEMLNNYIYFDKKHEIDRGVPVGEQYVVSNLIIYYSPYKKDIVNDIKNVIRKNMIVVDDSQTNIGLISFDSGEYYVKEIDITKNLGEWHHLDLHYPHDGQMSFTDFYEGLKHKLTTQQKGLVLLFGNPGTGKSHFIRHIIHDVSNIKTKDEKKKKFFIYVPPNLIPNMLEPGFITFLTDYVMETERQIILVMEDAEQVLAKRQNGNSGAANILNLTDGILNDILGFQVIATFNTELEDIDEALLREGRLIARKKFSVIMEKDVKILTDKIGLDIEIIGNMTLAEIYSKKEQSEILQHNIRDEEKKKFGFIL
jgi:hypothetical protein